jgi:putative transposase
MPRRPRLATGGLAYHVLNRRVGRLSLFEKSADYFAFEKILKEAHDRTGVIPGGLGVGPAQPID